MTAKEHLARAEELLASLEEHKGGWEAADVLEVALMAIGHGLVAVGVELGVPHASAPSVVVSGGG